MVLDNATNLIVRKNTTRTRTFAGGSATSPIILIECASRSATGWISQGEGAAIETQAKQDFVGFDVVPPQKIESS